MWKLAGVILVGGVIAGLWIRSETAVRRAATSEALLDSAIGIGTANAQIAQIQAASSRTIDAAARLAALHKNEIRAQSDARRQEIIHAPAEFDGPLAPVLRAQLDRLPESPRSDEDRNLAGTHASGLAAAADAGAVASGASRDAERRGPRP